jgi:putative NADH-flavin reductase
MKIAVFGATGGTGKRLVELALEKGHDVVAAARKPDAIQTKHDKLAVVKADVLDRASLVAAIEGVDAVISTFGPADNKNPGTLTTDAEFARTIQRVGHG